MPTSLSTESPAIDSSLSLAVLPASGSGVDRVETRGLVEDSTATTESGVETVPCTVSNFPLTNCCDDSPSLDESLLRDLSVKPCDLPLRPVSSALDASSIARVIPTMTSCLLVVTPVLPLIQLPLAIP